MNRSSRNVGVVTPTDASSSVLRRRRGPFDYFDVETHPGSERLGHARTVVGFETRIDWAVDEIEATLDQVGVLANGVTHPLLPPPPLLYGFFSASTTIRRYPVEKYAIRVVDDGIW